jgi:hypothetical protein
MYECLVYQVQLAMVFIACFSHVQMLEQALTMGARYDNKECVCGQSA